MKKINREKKNNEILLEIQTNFGKLTGIFELDNVQKKFEDEFENYVQISNGFKHLFFATELAEEYLKELLPQILEDALKQVWLETKAKTFNELNNKPCLLIYDSTTDNNTETVEVFTLPKKEVNKICSKIAEKAKEDSHKRMETEKLSSRGGNKPKKLSNYDFIHLDEFYNFYYLQAKSILEFYKWEKELTNKNDDDYTQYFLKIMFQPARHLGDLLYEKLDDPKLTADEKTKYLNIRDFYGAILRLNDYEKELLKITFQKISSENFSKQEILTFDALKPEKLTYHYLATIFEDKYKNELNSDTIKFSSDTIENNIKQIKRTKRGDD